MTGRDGRSYILRYIVLPDQGGWAGNQATSVGRHTGTGTLHSGDAKSLNYRQPLAHTEILPARSLHENGTSLHKDSIYRRSIGITAVCTWYDPCDCVSLWIKGYSQFRL